MKSHDSHTSCAPVLLRATLFAATRALVAESSRRSCETQMLFKGPIVHKSRRRRNVCRDFFLNLKCGSAASPARRRSRTAAHSVLRRDCTVSTRRATTSAHWSRRFIPPAVDGRFRASADTARQDRSAGARADGGLCASVLPHPFVGVRCRAVAPSPSAAPDFSACVVATPAGERGPARAGGGGVGERTRRGEIGRAGAGSRCVYFNVRALRVAASEETPAAAGGGDDGVGDAVCVGWFVPTCLLGACLACCHYLPRGGTVRR